MALSYSAIATYKKCPAKYNYAYNHRLPRGEAGPAAARGTRIHNSVEDFLLGKRPDVDEEISSYQEFFQSLKDLGAEPELKWGLTSDWKICDFEDPDALLRGLIDIRLPMEDGVAVYELKTGKYYEEHHYQMNLYATVELVRQEQEFVEVINLYLDQQDDRTIKYPYAMLNEYINRWEKQIERIMTDTRWMANPSFMCRWCDYSKDNGGPCPF